MAVAVGTSHVCLRFLREAVAKQLVENLCLECMLQGFRFRRIQCRFWGDVGRCVDQIRYILVVAEVALAVKLCIVVTSLEVCRYYGSCFCGVILVHAIHLVDWMAPGDDHLPAFVVRRLTTVACRKVIDAQDISLPPTGEYHVLVDGGTDFAHLLVRDGLVVAECRVQGHGVAQYSVLDEAVNGQKNEVHEQMPILDAAICVPQFTRKRRPVKDLGMVEPYHFVGVGMDLKRIVNPFLQKGIRVRTDPFHGRGAFVRDDALHFGLGIGPK
mmetsp:Transcript_27789/g.77863  ORF Transcript_27789/g.77863 Transcript_27789/m.77863 type:complete len:270 (-) Transcript_27789:1000-1809(-)